jgi:hypothetical protein
MTPPRRPNPRVGLATAALLLAGWLAALGVAIASDGSGGSRESAAPAASDAEPRVARPGRAGPGYVPE